MPPTEHTTAKEAAQFADLPMVPVERLRSLPVNDVPLVLDLYLCRVSWVPGWIAGWLMWDEGAWRWCLAGEMPTPWGAVFLAIERGIQKGRQDADGD